MYHYLHRLWYIRTLIIHYLPLFVIVHLLMSISTTVPSYRIVRLLYLIDYVYKTPVFPGCQLSLQQSNTQDTLLVLSYVRRAAYIQLIKQFLLLLVQGKPLFKHRGYRYKQVKYTTIFTDRNIYNETNLLPYLARTSDVQLIYI